MTATDEVVEQIPQAFDVPKLDRGEGLEPEQGKLTPKPKPVSLRDKDGMLTREGMRQVLLAGGSVMYKGRIIWRHQDLPSELDLAGENATKRGEAIARLKAQRAALDAQIKGAAELAKE